MSEEGYHTQHPWLNTGADHTTIAGKKFQKQESEQVLDMPSVVIGSVKQMVEQLYQRRERYAFSYYIVTDQHMQKFAPVVAQLAGKA